ncbi:MAG: hypothetical protein IKQ56_08785 [Lachnospiraceae bacterium]|nr:hypothetical protein [Lachnospiraceae bacterium]
MSAAEDFDVFFDGEGNLVMTSNDRAAAGSVSYRTVGWTVKKEDKPSAETECTRVNQIEYDRTTDPQDNSRVITTYKVSEDKLFEAIKKCDKTWAKELFRDGGYVYLDAIMVVVRDGAPSGGINSDGSVWGTVYFSAYSIKNAESWADPDSLDSHFGKCVYFGGDEEKLWGELSIKYYELESEDDIDSAVSLGFLGFDEEGSLEDTEYWLEAEDLSGYRFDLSYSTIYLVDKNGLTTKYGGQPVYNVDNSDLIYERVTVCFYYTREVDIGEYSYSYGKDHVAENSAELQAQPSDDPQFDVEKAIPSGEKLDAMYSFQDYYINIGLRKYSGSKFVPVDVYIWHYDDDGEYKEQKKRVYVDSDYSYYRIDSVKIFKAETAVIENGSLSENVVFHDISDAAIVCRINRGSYVLIPDEPDTAYISREQYEDGGQQALADAAESVCSGCEVRNDLLSINGYVFLKGMWERGSTQGLTMPQEPFVSVVSQSGIQITEKTANGDYGSRAYVTYRKLKMSRDGMFSETESTVIYETSDVNDVFVHTPVVCTGLCTDDRAGNQQYKPTVHKSLVLGKESTLSISETGEHIKAKGYGRRDYGKYSRKRQVRMPFAVYYGEKYVLPYTWVTLAGGSCTFYLPVGVEEGDYKIEYRVFAINCSGSETVEGVPTDVADQIMADGTGFELLSERDANISCDHYIACDDVTVTVTGRMYDLAVTDVKDYPGWWNVFYSERGVKRGVRYRAGRLSMEGEVIPDRVSDPPAPVMEQYYKEGVSGNISHDMAGSVPGAGYRIIFELKTIGSMRGENDGIVMLPKYYHISDDFLTRTEVRLYSRKDLRPVYTPVTLSASDRTYQPVFQKNVVDHSICERSIQLWSGSFRLADDIYAVPAVVDLAQYIQKKAGRIRQDDRVFLKGGFILVQFEILSVANGSVHLSYINEQNEAAGYCNMWKKQGFIYDRSLPGGKSITLRDGDFLIFDMKNTINSDYESMGTH